MTQPVFASIRDGPSGVSPFQAGPRVISGSANQALGAAICERLAAVPQDWLMERFPDGELRPTVPSVRGQDVYVLVSTGPPVHDNLIELLLLLDGCKRAGAERIRAVIPYLGYARQDRRNANGQPVVARSSAGVSAMRA